MTSPNPPQGKPLDGILMIVNEMRGHYEIVLPFPDDSLLMLRAYEKIFGNSAILIDAIRSESSGLPAGAKITTPTGIKLFLENGGRLIRPDLMRGITFKKVPEKDTLLLLIDNRNPEHPAEEIIAILKNKLEKLGIDYTSLSPTRLEIGGKANLSAIAGSGGSFTGSSEYLGNMGHLQG